MEGRERELETFRAANKLSRLPTIVSRVEQIARWLLLAVLVVLESILNGLLFAEGSETGIIGGVAQALMLSVLNVGSAVLFATLVLPLARHVHPAVRTVGAISILLYMGWVFGINLWIGHFRDLFIQNNGDVSVTALASRLSTAPLLLSDARSQLLVALGIFLNLVSVIDAGGLDDPYPGYGAIGRHRMRALSDYADQKARCLADLMRMRDNVIKDMSSVIQTLKTAQHELGLALGGRSRLHDNYRRFLTHLAECHARLQQRYRDANLQERSTETPKRFGVRPEAPDFLAVPALPVAPDATRDSKTQIIERMEHFVRAINNEFEVAAQQYKTVSRLTGQDDPSHVDS